MNAVEISVMLYNAPTMDELLSSFIGNEVQRPLKRISAVEFTEESDFEFEY